MRWFVLLAYVMLDHYVTSLMSLYLKEVVRSAGICNVRPLYHKLDVVVPE